MAPRSLQYILWLLEKVEIFYGHPKSSGSNLVSGPLIVFILMTGKELIVFFHKNLLKKFAKIFKLTEVKFLLKLWGKEGRRE